MRPSRYTQDARQVRFHRVQKLLLLLPLAAANLLLVSHADANSYPPSENQPVEIAYYDGYDDDDFGYVERRPHSRLHGRLVLRDGRYYYSRGGRWVIYNRGPVARPRGPVPMIHRDGPGRHRGVVVHPNVGGKGKKGGPGVKGDGGKYNGPKGDGGGKKPQGDGQPDKKKKKKKKDGEPGYA